MTTDSVARVKKRAEPATTSTVSKLPVIRVMSLSVECDVDGRRAVLLEVPDQFGPRAHQLVKVGPAVHLKYARP